MAEHMLCVVEGCGNVVQMKRLSLCGKHYQRYYKYGDAGFSKYNREQTGKACMIEGCNGPAGRRGMCRKHYRRVVVHGSADDASLSERYRRCARWIESHAAHVSEECLRWPFTVNDKGRGNVYALGRFLTAPAYMCTLAHGAAPSAQHEAAHSCGNGHRGCVNPRHLRWATHAENEADKLIHGTIVRGEKVNTAKLTESDVRTIRASAERWKAVRLAKQYGVHVSTIWNVIARKSWAWLE